MKRSKLNCFSICLLLFSIGVGYAQNKVITGVVSEGGVPLPGVSISIKGTDLGCQTDLNGSYSIRVKSGDVLLFSFIGRKDATYKVGDGNICNMELFDDTEVLKEVIVVGYGTSTKEAFTGSAAKVDSKVISAKNTSNVLTALAGESAGVNIFNYTGQPGADPVIRVRGFGSLYGNRDPLVMLDGIPLTEGFSSINTADVESMTVLKDAVATAIYGSRGANGVILITTKTGKGLNPYIEVDAKTGINWRGLPQYNVIRSPETYIEYSYEALKNYSMINLELNNDQSSEWAGQNLFNSLYGIHSQYNMWNVSSGEELIDPLTGRVRGGITRKYTPEDWRDYAYKASRRIETNLNMGGSGEKLSFFTSIGYLKDEGYVIKSDLERLSARLNLQYSPKKWFEARLKIGYSRSVSNDNTEGYDTPNLNNFVVEVPSIYPVFLRDKNGKIEKDIYGNYAYDYGINRKFVPRENVIGNAKYGDNRAIGNDVNLNVGFTFRLYDGVTFESTLGGQYSNRVEKTMMSMFYGSMASVNGTMTHYVTDRTSYNWLNMFRYKTSLGSHHLELLVAHESSSNESSYEMTTKNNLANPNSPDFNNAINVVLAKGKKEESRLESYFAQMNYDYANKYFLTTSIRRDGSSRFKKDKWGTFGSIGASWVVTKEEFMTKQNLFSNLKLKISYGVIGDQNYLGNYKGDNLWRISTYGGKLSIFESEIGNDELTWERAKMLQLGVELSLKNFLDVNIDYYTKDTDNMVFNRSIGPSVGFETIMVNDGKLRNQGLEFAVTGHLLNKKNAYLDLTINGEVLRNKLVRMAIDPSTGKEKVIDQAGITAVSKGYSVSDFYLREWAGVNVDTGQGQWYTYTYMDIDGTRKNVGSLTEFLAVHPGLESKLEKEITTDYSKATTRFVGKSAVPKIRGGIRLNAGYKGWELSTQFIYSLGGYVYDSGYASLMEDKAVGSGNWHQDISKRWQKPGDVTDVPRITGGAYDSTNLTSTRFLIKNDYLSLNNIKLGYNFSDVIIKQLGLTELSVFVSGDNLFLFSKRKGMVPTDPDLGYSSSHMYVPLSTVTGGVKIKF